MSALGAFNNQLVQFFENLADTFPEERDIKLALEAIRGAKKINPKMILDLFVENVYTDLHDAITREDDEFIIQYAKARINNQYNEISPALLIFEKYWPTISDSNRDTIWKFLKVLCILCERARVAKSAF
ncbi:hypothetical protein EBR66_05920 [bacterium]|nr:hypothetical protein [bacterium]